ncbi:MAG: FliA/WhiG family RNA polymerase sigma factor [Bryobacterales bacterium]|jgi:RNA polymerase sigma factor for flagellar operon FliA|nr:FliA/WhiG family RNA polymerase sigma factor [Bryobacterales bacterium]
MKTAAMRSQPTNMQDAASREALILEHLPQVRLIARKIQERLPESISIDDLVSAGVLGLISAIDCFDARHNVKLKTYAEYKIRGAILDSLRDLDWAPRQRRRLAKQIEAAISRLEQKLQGAPEDDAIAEELGVDLDTYRQYLVNTQGLTLGSLEYAGREEDGRELISFLADEDSPLPSEAVEQRELERVLADSIRKLPKMERTILGLYYQEELTLREIARIVNLHESRISQLKTQAILRLRANMRRVWPMERGA